MSHLLKNVETLPQTVIISKGTILFNNNEEVTRIAFLQSGSVIKHSFDGDKTIEAGSFLGIRSLYKGYFSAEYEAATEIELKIIPATSIMNFIGYFAQESDIHEDFFIELCTFINEFSQIYNQLYKHATSLFQAIIAIQKYYIKLSIETGSTTRNVTIPVSSDDYLLESKDFYKDITRFLDYETAPVRAFEILTNNNEAILRKQLTTIISLYNQYVSLVDYIQSLSSIISSNDDSCLFYIMSELADHLSNNGKDNKTIMDLLYSMNNTITQLDKRVNKDTNLNLDINYNRINFCLMLAENNSSGVIDDPIEIEASSIAFSGISESEQDVSPRIIEYTTNSIDKIFEYANFPAADAASFKRLLQEYSKLTDKFSRDDSCRQLYKSISEFYYSLYQLVFLKYVKEHTDDKLIHMFLDFGFLDETLLTPSQISILFQLDMKDFSDSPCKVYRMKDWLTAIYNGDEIPSKNEFDLEYTDYIRNLKKHEAFDTTTENRLLNDSEAKVKYEITNMLRYNNRLVCGNLSTFIPVLHKESFELAISKMYVTPSRINEAISKILLVDYSAFYRELLYSDVPNGIAKEVIQKEIYPVIILFPTIGSNAIMWQETTGKRSNSPGRFFFPSLLSSDMYELMLRIVGRFRWELCKSMQGSSWNNIRFPSLTSEYSDYIQFYKKNKYLSPERKDLLKAEISHCRNNTREVFVFDYCLWIRNEAEGAIRLNKVARGILATYCPFSKVLREKIAKQPIFEEAMMKFNRNHLKKSKETKNRYIMLTKKGVELTTELKETEHYYEL